MVIGWILKIVPVRLLLDQKRHATEYLRLAERDIDLLSPISRISIMNMIEEASHVE